jgi:hypothetical protein
MNHLLSIPLAPNLPLSTASSRFYARLPSAGTKTVLEVNFYFSTDDTMIPHQLSWQQIEGTLLASNSAVVHGIDNRTTTGKKEAAKPREGPSSSTQRKRQKQQHLDKRKQGRGRGDRRWEALRDVSNM